MILQKIASAIRRQDWFQVVIEVLIVIVGIFLGLQVTEWNDDRQDRIQEEEYLTRLHGDIAKSAALNENVIEVRLIENTRLENAIENLKVCALADADKDDFASAMYKLAKYLPPMLANSAFDELTSTGKFQTIKNVELRSAISELYQSMDSIKSTDEKMSQRVVPHVVFVERFFSYDIDKDNIGVDDISWDQMEINFDVLCQNNEVHRALSVINTYMIIVRNLGKQTVARQRAVLTQIEAELGKFQ